MDLAVTVHAGTSRSIRIWCCDVVTELFARNIGTERILTLVWAVMAVLAQERWPIFKQWRNVRAVWCMAIAAVLRYRLVLKAHRPTLLGMTHKAGFVQGVFLQHLGAR